MTKNEERNIEKCLAGLKAFKEIFVVDSHSADKTVALAQSMGAIVATFTWNGGYPKKKEWCLENLPFSYDWVLYVDADEEMSDSLSQEIHDKIQKNDDISAYFIRFDYIFLNKKLRYGHQISKLILCNRHKTKWKQMPDLDAINMWEVEGHYQPVVDGSTGVLRHRMVHDDHHDLYHYFYRHNRYSDWEATVRVNNISLGDETQTGTRAVLKRIFIRLPFQSVIAFFHSYVLRLGFLDGAAGFHFAVARGFYYWQTAIKVRERRRQLGQ